MKLDKAVQSAIDKVSEELDTQEKLVSKEQSKILYEELLVNIEARLDACIDELGNDDGEDSEFDDENENEEDEEDEEEESE